MSKKLKIEREIREGWELFKHKESGKEFSGVLAGFSWPGIKHGFCVVVGVEGGRAQKQHKLHVLQTFRANGLPELVRQYAKAAKVYQVKYGITDLSKKFLPYHNYFCEYENATGESFDIFDVAEKSFPVQVERIRSYLDPEKRLFFGHHDILRHALDPRYLKPKDLTEASAKKHPEVVALAYAVAAAEDFIATYHEKSKTWAQRWIEQTNKMPHADDWERFALRVAANLPSHVEPIRDPDEEDNFVW